MSDSAVKFKRGIIQSRGLGDIIIALPIARHYYDQGEEIVWPICREFYSSVRDHVPWVTWVAIDTDAQGQFFLQRPLAVFKEMGVDADEALYLYQYLNVAPGLTDPEMFNILKFDQYKYQAAGVPFRDKWQLDRCVERVEAGESALRDRIGQEFDLNKPYAVCHLTGSSARVDQSVITWLDPAVQIINVDSYLSDSIFDWWGILQGAHSIICLDSAIANMVDQLCIEGPELYWIRRSGWDLTPVLGSAWTIVPTNLPIVEPKRVDPAVEARKIQAQISAQNSSPIPTDGRVVSHVPFETDRSKMPTSFMHALRK
jgi:hypothetical protein